MMYVLVVVASCSWADLLPVVLYTAQGGCNNEEGGLPPNSSSKPQIGAWTQSGVSAGQ